nr:uncharacterized mitochondrial protein AtMg00810-like [Tanacetum cinerariifolium]
LFTRRFDDDILVVQVYVDDIIFGSTDPRYATLFSDLMKSRFEMSMMGEMTFFLGLQVNQSPSGIFINQSKYVHEILKKYGLNTSDIVGTPMDIKDKLDLDQIRTPVDGMKYCSMISALMYLTSSRPDIVHATCVCARYQDYPTEKHLKEDKEEQIKKAEEEARLNAICKIEVIKVVRKEAKKLGIHTKEAISTKAGELFKKAQDAEHDVLKRQHTEKVRKSLELRKHKYDSYMWIVSSRLKPKPIIDIKIHLKINPVVITVYRGTDGRNFDVHKPFLFGAFGISELDELREIIPKNKNTVSALPAPEQASSQTSRRKQKHMELEPETRILGLECNQTLFENVPFVNNMVIEEPGYGIFFTDEFGDQAFQRWSDIDKVGLEALVSYLVAASMVKSPKNARFSMKLRKLIAKYPEQEKLKSKKVKLEALGYNMD